MTTLEILIAARKLIEQPENWCKAVLAENIGGASIHPRNRRACRWCATGAIIAVTEGTAGFQAIGFLRAAAPGTVIAYYNDDPRTTHAQILALFDRAIKACGEAA